MRKREAGIVRDTGGKLGTAQQSHPATLLPFRASLSAPCTARTGSATCGVHQKRETFNYERKGVPPEHYIYSIANILAATTEFEIIGNVDCKKLCMYSNSFFYIKNKKFYIKVTKHGW